MPRVTPKKRRFVERALEMTKAPFTLIAKRAGVSRHFVWSVNKGKGIRSSEDMRRIARAFRSGRLRLSRLRKPYKRRIARAFRPASKRTPIERSKRMPIELENELVKRIAGMAHLSRRAILRRLASDGFKVSGTLLDRIVREHGISLKPPAAEAPRGGYFGRVVKKKNARGETFFEITFQAHTAEAVERVKRTFEALKKAKASVPSAVEFDVEGRESLLRMAFSAPQENSGVTLSFKRLGDFNEGQLKALPAQAKTLLMENIARAHSTGLHPATTADWWLLFDGKRFNSLLITEFRFFEPLQGGRDASLVFNMSRSLAKNLREEFKLREAYARARELAPGSGRKAPPRSLHDLI